MTNSEWGEYAFQLYSAAMPTQVGQWKFLTQDERDAWVRVAYVIRFR
jgi:hypothetical protein